MPLFFTLWQWCTALSLKTVMTCGCQVEQYSPTKHAGLFSARLTPTDCYRMAGFCTVAVFSKGRGNDKKHVNTVWFQSSLLGCICGEAEKLCSFGLSCFLLGLLCLFCQVRVKVKNCCHEILVITNSDLHPMCMFFWSWLNENPAFGWISCGVFEDYAQCAYISSTVCC